MCSLKSKLHDNMIPETIARINGRPVLQPKSNQVPILERRPSLKKNSPKPQIPSPKPLTTKNIKIPKPNSLPSPPISPKLKSPRQPAIKRGKDAPCNELSSSAEKIVITPLSKPTPIGTLKKSKSCVGGSDTVKYFSSKSVEKPGSIAAARREEVAMMQEERKMKIAHYGRTKSAKLYEKKEEFLDSSGSIGTTAVEAKKRCSFITPNSDPIYVGYHDEEWGVPVHDDKQLFELLVSTSAQVGSDWTSILKKRQVFREAFSEFDAELVAKFNEKKIQSIIAEYGIELSQVRAAVDNSKQILQVKKEFGSFHKYLWGFVNHKPIVTQYKSCQKIPVKTSKSETISKDMVRRGFRFVGPTVIHSLMQAGGLTNDHLVTCPRHLQCTALARVAAPAL